MKTLFTVSETVFSSNTSGVWFNGNEMKDVLRIHNVPGCLIPLENGHDGISVRVVKLCNLTITKPLSIKNENCLQQGVFPD